MSNDPNISENVFRAPLAAGKVLVFSEKPGEIRPGLEVSTFDRSNDIDDPNISKNFFRVPSTSAVSSRIKHQIEFKASKKKFNGLKSTEKPPRLVEKPPNFSTNQEFTKNLFKFPSTSAFSQNEQEMIFGKNREKNLTKKSKQENAPKKLPPTVNQNVSKTPVASVTAADKEVQKKKNLRQYIRWARELRVELYKSQGIPINDSFIKTSLFEVKMDRIQQKEN